MSLRTVVRSCRADKEFEELRASTKICQRDDVRHEVLSYCIWSMTGLTGLS